MKMAKIPRCSIYCIYWQMYRLRSIAGSGPFHTHLRIWVILIVEDLTVTVECRTAIKVMFFTFLNLCSM